MQSYASLVLVRALCLSITKGGWIDLAYGTEVSYVDLSYTML